MDKLLDFLTIMAWFGTILSFAAVAIISTNIEGEDLYVEKNMKMLPWALVLMVSMFVLALLMSWLTM